MNMQECITACWNCRNECQTTLFNHCLQKDGEHTQQKHVKLMIDCIQICQIAADFMTRNSQLYKSICEACAKICETCADSCTQLKDTEMQRCADACRQCAETCRRMSQL